MAWVRIEDTVTEHRKHLKAGPAACWLWVCGIAYCQRQLSDGFIPDEAIPILGVLKGAPALAAQLAAVGLFDRVEGGYRVHDYHDYNDTREEAIERKADLHAKRSRSGRAGGLKSGEARRTKPKQTPEANSQANIREANEAERSPIPSHPIPSQVRERAREQPPASDTDPTLAERVLDAFRMHWKRAYGYDCSLLPNALEYMQLEQQIAAHPEARLLTAIEAYFATTDEYVRRAKHPLPLFLRDPLKHLAKEARVSSRPRGCRHEPACADEASHTSREMAERKAFAS